MNSAHEHARALLARARDDRVPFGVAFRYEEFVGDEPRVDAARFESVVTRTIDWASERLVEEKA